jgi:hypothetical protein
MLYILLLFLNITTVPKEEIRWQTIWFHEGDARLIAATVVWKKNICWLRESYNGTP